MKTGSELRAEVLEEAKAAVCRDRQNAYGDAEDNFQDIADVATVVFADKLADGEVWTALDVAKFNLIQKICRLRGTPDHRDTWVDIIGYGACGAGIAQRPIEDAAEAAAMAVLQDPVVQANLEKSSRKSVHIAIPLEDVLRGTAPDTFGLSASGEPVTLSIGNAQADFGGAQP